MQAARAAFECMFAQSSPVVYICKKVDPPNLHFEKLLPSDLERSVAFINQPLARYFLHLAKSDHWT